MAIDTALKRRSMMNVSMPWRGVIPAPDGAFEATDRYVLLFFYGGLVSSTPQQLDTLPNLAYEYNTSTHDFDFSAYFSGATGYTIAPAVPAGWTFNTTTAVMTVATSTENTFGPYTITATNAIGNTDGNTFTVKVAQSTVRAYRGFLSGTRYW